MGAVEIVIIVLVVLLLLYVAVTYNSLVQLRNRVRDQWSQIDIQLKRRFDLIPNLVETVKAYAKHEKDTLEAVMKARNNYTNASSHEEEMAADSELTKAVTRLFAVTESYPDLKANENFKQMRLELTETEDKIAMARQFYSDVVLKYNDKVTMFPGNIVAGLFKFKEEKYFEATAEEKENVKVKF